MKKILILCTVLLVFVFVGCSQTEEVKVPLDCGEHLNEETWKNDCNTCSCIDGEIMCTEIACADNSDLEDFNLIDDIKFNTGLETYEKEWLSYLEVKYPNSKIYYIRTNLFNCEDCYELSYKKDREVIKIKVLDGDKQSENLVQDDIATEIENGNVCKLFSGSWNECPALCSTDEESCKTECGFPVCEFDYNTIVLQKVGDECGGLDKGDCEFGLKCFYASQDDDYGVCQEK
ncbi:MAG: hypothetical protein PF569_04830 [Candidatus Woesearchaeota archaeon]|jgi:hypothetical protein|nr:hypothetical protein [Candidatus Woesearchaeota archaeon]